MGTTLTRTCILTLLALLLTSPLWGAESDELILFKLEVAGYHLGMSYDDAILVRPAHFVQDTHSAQQGPSDRYFDVYAEQVYVNDILMDIWLRFKHEKLYKVMVHFSPEEAPSLTAIFNKALGTGEDRSKSLPDRDGNMVHQSILYWDYPTAKIYLIKTSANHDFATVGMIAKPSFAETFVDSE